MQKINILGTKYTIEKKAYRDDPVFEKQNADGYCDSYQRRIVYCDLDTCDRWDDAPEDAKRECEKEILRHEIVHAFLDQSGLMGSSVGIENGWARNEEMVDWIAIQSPKLLQAFEEAGCL